MPWMNVHTRAVFPREKDLTFLKELITTRERAPMRH